MFCFFSDFNFNTFIKKFLVFLLCSFSVLLSACSGLGPPSQPSAIKQKSFRAPSTAVTGLNPLKNDHAQAEEVSPAAGATASSTAPDVTYQAMTFPREGKSPELRTFWDNHRDILPKDYALVKDIPTPVYKMALASTAGVRPVAMLDGGPGAFRWVSLEEPFTVKAGPLRWFMINPSQYVEDKHLERFWPSTFKGVDIVSHPLEGRYGWVVFDSYTATEPGKIDYFDGKLVKKHTLVKILETRHINGWDWHRIEGNLWLEQRRVALIKKAERPEQIPPDSKWIDINLYEQTITAYEGDNMVYVSLISSGLPGFETEQGLFRIWAKVRFAKMGGGKPGKDFYWLEDVPYHMYFFQGFAIHGAYWHNNFGVKQSHGCVNISCLDAAWFFNWTLPEAPADKWVINRKGKDNTWVWIHE